MKKISVSATLALVILMSMGCKSKSESHTRPPLSQPGRHATKSSLARPLFRGMISSVLGLFFWRKLWESGDTQLGCRVRN